MSTDASTSSPPAKMGRPSKVEDVAEQLLTLLSHGCYLETACTQVGIHPDTLDNWRKWGADGREPYAEFLAMFDAARSSAENRLLVEISEGRHNWQARAWILERTRPERYRQRQTTEHTGANGGPIVALIAPTDEERARDIAGVLSQQGLLDS